MQSNFEAWREWADIPAKQDGVWVDLETGFAYNPDWDYIADRAIGPRVDQPTALSAKAADSRAAAKMLGGKSLTGTMAQKEWAEKIRAGKLARMSEQHAALALSMAVSGTAKFWIETRFKRGPEIGVWLTQHKPLVEKLAEMKAIWSSSLEMSALERTIRNHLLDIGIMPATKRGRMQYRAVS